MKVAFLHALRRRVDEILAESKKQGANRGVIVCGDLNLAVSRDDVCLKFDFESLYSEEEKSALKDLMAPPLVDAFRQLHPEATASCAKGSRGFTVWDQRSNARSRDEGLRIDFFLVSDNLKATKCEVARNVPWPWSDHAALVLEVEEAAAAVPVNGGGEGGTTGAASSVAPPSAAASFAAASFAAAAAAGAPPFSPPPSSPQPPSSKPPSAASLASTPLLVRPPPPHEPVPQSSLRHPRWQPDPKQPTVMALFSKKRAADESAGAAEGKKKKEEEK